jgi:hypothetical protein
VRAFVVLKAGQRMTEEEVIDLFLRNIPGAKKFSLKDLTKDTHRTIIKEMDSGLDAQISRDCVHMSTQQN